MFQPDSTPVFSHPDRRYHYLESCVSAKSEGGSVTFGGILENGQPLKLTITKVSPEIIRVRYRADGDGIEHETPYLAGSEFEPMHVELNGDEKSYFFDIGTMTLRVSKSPWQMTVSAKTGDILFQQEIFDKAFVLPVTYPTGYSEDPDGRRCVHENFSLAPGEHIFGLGPKYMAVNKRGHRAVMWCSDTMGTNTTELSYMSVPFFISSRGYGLFLNHGAKSIFELGSYSTVSGSIWVDSPLMDYFLIFGRTPAEILAGYTLLTGRPAVPPKWAFGLWMSRCWYFDRATIEAVVERMRALGIPLDVINIDPAWIKGWSERRQPGCVFEWNTDSFPEPEEFLRSLREDHVRVCLWENPYVPDETDFYEEGEKEGYLVKKPDGTLAEPDHPLGSGMGIIDYTNPAAVEWVKRGHRRLLSQGIAAFKTDYGESIPEDAVFHNGKTGREMHNFFPLLYNRAVHEVIEETNGEGIVFGRSGGCGSQRYPTQWAADAQCTFAGMAGSLKGGLSYALSGGALWSHDIGGYVNPKDMESLPEPVLYIRWAQFGLLSPIARFHGRGAREPWEFGEEAVEIVRKFALLRSRLVPYIYSYAVEASRTGMPVMRPLYLEFPDDPHSPYEELQYLLGRELLIAPVFDESGKRTVYLPPGSWTDFWEDEVFSGPVFLRLDVPLDGIPIFVREDSIVPLGREMQYVEEHPWDEFRIDIHLKRRAAFSLHDGEEIVNFEASMVDGGAEVKISPSQKSYEIVLHNFGDVERVSCEGSAAADFELREAKGSPVMSVRADGEVHLRIVKNP